MRMPSGLCLLIPRASIVSTPPGEPYRQRDQYADGRADRELERDNRCQMVDAMKTRAMTVVTTSDDSAG